MTVMTPEAPVRALDEILADVLQAESSLDRLLAFAEGERANYAGSLIADFCPHCRARGDDAGPWVVTFAGLLRHLVETDGAGLVRLRGRWHTTDNVRVWSAEDGGYGRALGRGWNR